MFHVDNSGQGNCLYNAYAIALMYLLRAKNNNKMTEDIFDKLGLEEEQRAQLRKLLSKDIDLAFTREEIKTIIEPILGRATRHLAAEYTKVEFKSSPQDSPLFSSLHYGLEFGFKRLLTIYNDKKTLELIKNDTSPLSLKLSSELSKLSSKLSKLNPEWVNLSLEFPELIDNDYSDPNYMEAEIYRVEGMLDALQDSLLARTPYVIEEFGQTWKKKKQELEEQEFKEEEPIKKETFRDCQTAILDDILRKETVRFLTSNNYEYLNQYTDHLKEESRCGTDESLNVVHRAIQNERKVRNAEGKSAFVYDNEIALQLYRNGVPVYDVNNPEMILNHNEDISHWTSIIPDSIFTYTLTEKEQKLVDILEQMQLDNGCISSVKPYSSTSDWISDLKKQIDIIKKSQSIEIKEQEVGIFFQLLSKATFLVEEQPLWKKFLMDVFAAFIECVPTLRECQTTSLKDDNISAKLAPKWGFYGQKVVADQEKELSSKETVKETVNDELILEHFQLM